MNHGNELLLQTAASFVGIHEVGPNAGPEVEMFQRAVDGKASGESWCMCMVQYCVQQVIDNSDYNTSLAESEGCVDVWNKSAHLRVTDPYPGCIIIWQKIGSWQGHTGIIEKVDQSHIYTIEGNTSDGSGLNRDGDGVYRKTRPHGNMGVFEPLGFLDPFLGQE